MNAPDRLGFGIFLAPFHPVGENPTTALHRDLELIEWLDRLGYDEAWFGEHHSAGFEIIASPEVFIAAAAARTGHIRLGTGVSSLPYHHPFMLADRMVLLDHLTMGRAMLGVGPGALPSDAFMLGIDTLRQRVASEVDAMSLESDVPGVLADVGQMCGHMLGRVIHMRLAQAIDPASLADGHEAYLIDNDLAQRRLLDVLAGL